MFSLHLFPVPRFSDADMSFAFSCGVFFGVIFAPACALIAAAIISGRGNDENP